MENLGLLINELRKLKNEAAWVEFKHDNYDPQMIGEDISALANSATLCEKNCAYMIWGIDDATHEIVGTDYDLQSLKKGDQELENWLRSLLSNNADFSYEPINMPEGRVGVLIIQKALNMPVSFKKADYIRVGSYTKKLNEFPALQSQLWDRLRNERFEERYAKYDLQREEALDYLEIGSYFELMGIRQPIDPEGVLHYLIEENCVVKQDNGLYAITNLGAILFAKKLTDFDRLARKAIRVVLYEGNNKLHMLKEEISGRGYAVRFDELIRFIGAMLPSEEVIENGLRSTVALYPTLAVREAIANALIHQDFSVSGTGPTVEIFENRIEITNSGTPLVDINRIVDNPPKSRNEKMAQLMRRLGICEELGTGWDKMIISCEAKLLPAPKINLYEDSTRVTLFSHIAYSNLSVEDKIWACYLHACIKYIQGEQLTNSSLRDRFGLKDSAAANISRLIKDAVERKLIKPLDPTTAPRYMKYIPIWA
ncbi:MAG: putative DNA binding domain-containing protein [Lachnospiraceae bacterium]|nr:putative DNA binding domain-containing protein [Lachnospiraceae bacterium]